jgi:RNA polymerase-interacting CarD/CdnL/TRCF family regulator
MEKSEIPKLLDHLRQPVKAADTWKQRNLNNLKLFASGSAFDLAEIIESLTGLSETKSLSFGENKTLERPRRLLICEIAEVMGESREAIREQLEDALNARTKKVALAGNPAASAPLPADDIIRHSEPRREQEERALSIAI